MSDKKQEKIEPTDHLVTDFTALIYSIIDYYDFQSGYGDEQEADIPGNEWKRGLVEGHSKVPTELDAVIEQTYIALIKRLSRKI